MKHLQSLLCFIACVMVMPIAADDDSLHIHIQTRLHQPRPKLLAFVGVQTGFGSTRRRQLLRETWFPGSRDALDE